MRDEERRIDGRPDGPGAEGGAPRGEGGRSPQVAVPGLPATAFRPSVAVQLEVNGETWVGEVPATETLATFLRDRLGLTGTKIGCEEGNCGACSVILDGALVYSCLVLAAACDGGRVETVEGLAREDRLHPVQEAFVAEDALQCGFCTPGQIMAVKALLDREPRPTPEQVQAALAGNLCRCGAYPRIVKAALRAAATMAGGAETAASRRGDDGSADGATDGEGGTRGAPAR